MLEKKDLYSMLPSELEEYFVSLGEPKFRAKQVFPRLAAGCRIDGLTNLSKTLRERLKAETLDTLPTVEEKLVSKIDGTVKYLFRLFDGSCIESVLMKYKHGNTLCISSQVGCYMGCKFCASTIGGKLRDLYPSELLGQVIVAGADSGERVSNIVMMGIGEPLDNFDNVVKFLRLVNHPDGLNIGYRHISLSTCGIVTGIYKLAEVDLPITLSISLHAATDEKRSAIMPINNKWKIAELLSKLPPIKIYQPEYVAPVEEFDPERNIEITRLNGDVYMVEANWIRRAMSSVNFDDHESRLYFENLLRKNGVFDKLEARGVEEGDTIIIYDLEFEYVK